MLPSNRPPTHPGEMLLKEFLEPLACRRSSGASDEIPFQRLNAIVRSGGVAPTRRSSSRRSPAQGRRSAGTAGEVDLWHAAGARTAAEDARPPQERMTDPCPRSAAWTRERFIEEQT
jgi:hypothetical protein